MITPKQSYSVNDLIRRYPVALEILTSHGIDTCCGGDQPLTWAAHEAGVDADTLLLEIVEAQEKETQR